MTYPIDHLQSLAFVSPAYPHISFDMRRELLLLRVLTFAPISAFANEDQSVLAILSWTTKKLRCDDRDAVTARQP